MAASPEGQAQTPKARPGPGVGVWAALGMTSLTVQYDTPPVQCDSGDMCYDNGVTPYDFSVTPYDTRVIPLPFCHRQEACHAKTAPMQATCQPRCHGNNRAMSICHGNNRASHFGSGKKRASESVAGPRNGCAVAKSLQHARVMPGRGSEPMTGCVMRGGPIPFSQFYAQALGQMGVWVGVCPGVWSKKRHGQVKDDGQRRLVGGRGAAPRRPKRSLRTPKSTPDAQMWPGRRPAIRL